MATAVDLYRSLKDYLRISHRLVGATGTEINVGENFKMRFTVSNQAPSPSLNNPMVIFNNTSITIRATQFAAPTRGTTRYTAMTLELPDKKLHPGESSYVDIEFIAEQEITGPSDVYTEENVAEVYVTGDVDLNAYFSITQYMKEVEQEIAPT